MSAQHFKFAPKFPQNRGISFRAPNVVFLEGNFSVRRKLSERLTFRGWEQLPLSLPRHNLDRVYLHPGFNCVRVSNCTACTWTTSVYSTNSSQEKVFKSGREWTAGRWQSVGPWVSAAIPSATHSEFYRLQCGQESRTKSPPDYVIRYIYYVYCPFTFTLPL